MKKACGSHGVPRIYFQLLYLQHKANTTWAASCCGAKHGEKNSSRSAFPNQNECHRLPFNIDIVEPKEWGPGPCQFWRSIALFGFASNVKVINHDKPQFRLQIHLHFSKALSYGFGAVCSLGGWSWLTCIIMSLVSRFLRLGHSIAFLHGHWIMGNTHWFHGKTIWKTFFPSLGAEIYQIFGQDSWRMGTAWLVFWPHFCHFLPYPGAPPNLYWGCTKSFAKWGCLKMVDITKWQFFRSSWDMISLFLPQHLMFHDPKSYFPMNSLGISHEFHENHENLGFRRSQYPQSAALLRPCTLSRGLRGRRTQASIILFEFTP